MKPPVEDLIVICTLFMPLLIVLATAVIISINCIISIYERLLFKSDKRNSTLSSLMKGGPEMNSVRLYDKIR